jgi:hypothetical protein
MCFVPFDGLRDARRWSSFRAYSEHLSRPASNSQSRSASARDKPPISLAAISAFPICRAWIARWKRPCGVPWLVIIFDAAGATAGSDNSGANGGVLGFAAVRYVARDPDLRWFRNPWPAATPLST